MPVSLEVAVGIPCAMLAVLHLISYTLLRTCDTSPLQRPLVKGRLECCGVTVTLLSPSKMKCDVQQTSVYNITVYKNEINGYMLTSVAQYSQHLSSFV